ncbi:Vacuolar fusion protein [Drechslerella dactyloides]|uniref:Vacuolar fusion protein MON1 n=1 Tax=Drechslerella dactyloides TaxID=74499 RepID=A0AAD6NIT0_DREDA|nr:Vacuolar fusion protein [Drechslerella dactyloides]
MDLYSKTIDMVVAPLKDISDSVNSTIANSAERTWKLVKGGTGEASQPTEEGSSSGAAAAGAMDTPAESTAHTTVDTSVDTSDTQQPAGSMSAETEDHQRASPSETSDETLQPQPDHEAAAPIPSGEPTATDPELDVTEDQDQEDPLTPRPSTPARPPEIITSPSRGAIQITEDYFTRPTSRGDLSNASTLRATDIGAMISGSCPVTPSLERLQSKPTTALSLSQVHANSAVGSSGASIIVPYTESSSIRSLVPTIDSGDNDVAGMLGEILNEDATAFAPGYGQTWALSKQMEEEEELVEDSEEEWDESDNDEDLSENERIEKWRCRKKHFFILSSAGKPVYSRYGDEAIVSQFMGVIQTIISFFQEGKDPLRSFTAGRHKFTILQEGHLYLCGVSSLGETDSQLRTQLDMLYTQVLSTLTLTTVTKVFSERENFDLRRLLGGTEVFLDALSDAMARGEPNILLGSLECVKMRKHVREKINNILLKCRTSNLLYGLIIADGRLVSVIRPKRHSLHPPDLQLFISMLFSASTFKGGGEHWTPICLPKFNAKGFLHAYICFFQPEIALVLISPTRESFFEMKAIKDNIIEQLDQAASIPIIEGAVKRGRYLASDLIDGTVIQHFLYKSKANVQFTMPSFDPHFSTPHARRRLMVLYQRLHAAVHARGAHLKVHHSIRRRSVSLAWVTPTFELYCVAGAGTPRNVLAKHANAIVGWVKREEERLFIVGGATF